MSSDITKVSAENTPIYFFNRRCKSLPACFDLTDFRLHTFQSGSQSISNSGSPLTILIVSTLTFATRRKSSIG